MSTKGLDKAMAGLGEALVGHLIKRMERRLERIMGRLDSITEGISAVSTQLDGVQTEVQQVADQLAAGNISEAEISAAATSLQDLASRLGDTKTSIDQLVEPDAGEGSDGGGTPVPDDGTGTPTEPTP